MLDVLPSDLAEVAFENMKKEVAWKVMYHRGTSGAVIHTVCVRLCRTIFHYLGGEVPRMVAVEGEVAADGR